MPLNDVTVTSDSMVISWLCPTTTTSSSLHHHKSSFSSWLNRENFQLEKNGHRYRVANGDRRSSHSNGASGAVPAAGDVVQTRSRLHSDPASDVGVGADIGVGVASKNVRFDDVLPPPPVYVNQHGSGGGNNGAIQMMSIRKPVRINCTGDMGSDDDGGGCGGSDSNTGSRLPTSERYISLG